MLSGDPGRAVRRRGVVVFDDDPARGDADRRADGRRDEHVTDEVKRTFVENRAVQPDDMIVVVFDFRGAGAVMVEAVRPEMAVGRSAVVNVLRSQRRRKQQERDGDQQGCRTCDRPNHGCIIRGCGVRVNEVAVNRRSETGH